MPPMKEVSVNPCDPRNDKIKYFCCIFMTLMKIFSPRIYSCSCCFATDTNVEFEKRLRIIMRVMMRKRVFIFLMRLSLKNLTFHMPALLNSMYSPKNQLLLNFE